MNLVAKKYYNNGFIIKKNLLSKKFCNQLVNLLKRKKPKVHVPFSNQAIGYGNLITDKSVSKILKNKFILNFTKKVVSKEIEFNHLMIANKPSLIGPDAEFHQEVYNIKTYAPGYTSKDYKKFMQIFIALEDHNYDNGCLRIIPKSHTLGELPNEDFITSALVHKRRTKHSSLIKAFKKLGYLDVKLKRGDAIFFNHLIIHGSANNISPKSRYAVVLQARNKNINKDMKIFKKETKYRQNFVIKNIETIRQKLVSKNKYRDFAKV